MAGTPLKVQKEHFCIVKVGNLKNEKVKRTIIGIN
jgi:hypothetical protein